MTRVHFKMLAERIKANRPIDLHYDDYPMIAWRAIVSDIAEVCAMSNSRFDRDKFLEACGYGSD